MRQRSVSLELAMFDSVVPPETLQLGSGYQGLGLRESRGYGGVGTRKRERFDFEKRKSKRDVTSTTFLQKIIVG